MELSLSPQVKVVALVGLVAALGLGVAMTMLGRSQPSSSDATPTAPLKHYHRTAPVRPVPAKAAARPASAAARAPAPAHPRKPKPAPAVAANGLPTALDALLHQHRIVVVSLYDPEVAADGISFAEARAGAKAANAGFLGVDVLDERVSGPLTALVGGGTILPDPGILVFRQPGTLMNRIGGFADRDAVAQAVASALVSDPPAAPPSAATAAAAAP